MPDTGISLASRSSNQIYICWSVLGGPRTFHPNAHLAQPDVMEFSDHRGCMGVDGISADMNRMAQTPSFVKKRLNGGGGRGGVSYFRLLGPPFSSHVYSVE